MNIRTILNEFKLSLLHLVYPSQCLHCSELTPPDQHLLCPTCQSLLELIDPKERCRYCFDNLEGQTTICHRCGHGRSLFSAVGAAFDYSGPAASLIRKLKYSNRPYLAEGGGAFLAAQFDRLNWPFPDAIIPVPLSHMHLLERGYNQSFLLAEQLSKFLQVPVWDVLKRKSGDYSQAGLNLTQRKNLEGKHFKLKKDFPLEDKTLLLVDDVFTSGSTLRHCAETLAEKSPSNLYALTFCRATL